MKAAVTFTRLGFVLLFTCWLGPLSAAQSDALKIIGDFADRLCPPVSLDTSTTHSVVEADAKLEVSNLLKKLTDAGVSATAKYETSASKNLLQKDLAGALKDAQTCRLQIWNDLNKRFALGDVGLPKKDCRISGRVLNSDDDAPIPSARVMARSKTKLGDWQPIATTSTDGNYAGRCMQFSEDDFPLQLAITHNNWRCATFGSSFTEDGWQSVYPGGDKDVNLIVSIKKISRLKVIACKH